MPKVQTQIGDNEILAVCRINSKVIYVRLGYANLSYFTVGYVKLGQIKLGC